DFSALLPHGDAWRPRPFRIRPCRARDCQLAVGHSLQPSLGVKIDLSVQHTDIGFGILAGLMLGKTNGIMIAGLIAVKTGFARLPQAVNWRSLVGYGFLAGIGFTMSLFIAMLAFNDPALVYAAKRGIIAASVFAGLAGAVMLRASRPLRDVS